jgi:hypothetical protein
MESASEIDGCLRSLSGWHLPSQLADSTRYLRRLRGELAKRRRQAVTRHQLLHGG